METHPVNEFGNQVESSVARSGADGGANDEPLHKRRAGDQRCWTLPVADAAIAQQGGSSRQE